MLRSSVCSPVVSSEAAGGRRRERGAVTAEAAMVLPALVLVTLSLVWMSGLVLTQVRLVDGARETARAIARAETVDQAWAQGRRVAPEGAVLDVADGDPVTVRVSAPVALPGFLSFLPSPPLEAIAVTASEGGPGASG